MSGDVHIVVVDDDEDVRTTVQDYLLRHGYAVSAVPGGEALRALMAERAVDLALLDINMPGEDGLSIARDLRSRGQVGIIMLTANTDGVDKVVGLELGADDYVTKPFDLRELLARVRSVLRRARQGGQAPAQLGREVHIGKCMLNLETHQLFEADGTPVRLTAMEFDLLRVFSENPDRVLSREQLLEKAHSKDMEAFDRSIDTRIARLRQKVEHDPAHPQAIVTVRGAGYVFRTGPSTQ